MRRKSTGLTRRRLLQAAGYAAVGGSLFGTLGVLQRTRAASLANKGGGYKALVCILLEGGADSYNFLVPRMTGTGNPATDYNVYAQTRQNMAVGYDEASGTWNPASILPLNGSAFGLNPMLPGLQGLYNAGRMAGVLNVGSLIEPANKAQIQAGNATLPPQLFSHSDQSIQWQTAHADSLVSRGWFGKAADLLSVLNASPSPSMNISVADSNLLQVGETVFPYAISTEGPIGLLTGWDPNGDRLATVEALMDNAQGLFESEHAAIKRRAQDNYDLIFGALEALPALATPFPSTYLGDQLHIVARMIGIRAALGASRQTFVVRLWGWDTHDNQPADLPGLLAELDGALPAFYDATVELGVAADVTTFTQTEFSRTLNSNGNGTDHGWGGHQFVVGDAVAGGQLYGTPPDLTLDGPDDLDRGRIIPTYSVEQYAATLASWFGVQGSDLSTVFPNIGNFGASDLGFML